MSIAVVSLVALFLQQAGCQESLGLLTAAMDAIGGVQGQSESPESSQQETSLLGLDDATPASAAGPANPMFCVDKSIGIYTDPPSSNCFICYGSPFPGADNSSDLGHRSCCGVGKVYVPASIRYPVGACFDAPPLPPSPLTPPPPPTSPPPPSSKPPPPPPLLPPSPTPVRPIPLQAPSIPQTTTHVFLS
jgi:hypothetical protein